MVGQSQEFNYDYSLNDLDVGNLGVDQDLEVENNSKSIGHLN